MNFRRGSRDSEVNSCSSPHTGGETFWNEECGAQNHSKVRPQLPICVAKNRWPLVSCVLKKVFCGNRGGAPGLPCASTSWGPLSALTRWLPATNGFWCIGSHLVLLKKLMTKQLFTLFWSLSEPCHCNLFTLHQNVVLFSLFCLGRHLLIVVELPWVGSFPPEHPMSSLGVWHPYYVHAQNQDGVMKQAVKHLWCMRGSVSSDSYRLVIY